jgi:hypothetical protein
MHMYFNETIRDIGILYVILLLFPLHTDFGSCGSISNLRYKNADTVFSTGMKFLS